MNRSLRYVIALVLGGAAAGLTALSAGPRSFLVGNFLLYAFAAGILLRYPDAVYAQREGAAPTDALWLGAALCGLIAGINVLERSSDVADAPLTIFVTGLFVLGIALGYWAAVEEL